MATTADPATTITDNDGRFTKDISEVPEALGEFRIMLRYALSEGLQIDDKTREAVSGVQHSLTFQAMSPGGGISVAPDLFTQLMEAHVALSRIVAPATPLSLKATEPAPGWLGSLRRPPLVLTMIVVGVVAALGFVVTNVIYGTGTKSPVGEKLVWCFAAALGAVFYVLFTALNYVKDRTFDPRYSPLYVIRFFLGVLAGLILAIVLGAPLFDKNPTISNLGPAVIALLGGFSTEAVYQILQRLVDILVAAVRGDDSANAKTKASQELQKELLALADDPTMPSDLKSKAIAAAKRVGK